MDDIVTWSEWMPFTDAALAAPRLPGVYAARTGPDGPIVYFGHAGERSGSGRPQGLRGRLTRYLSGKALASGLGEAVFDRALADPTWVRHRLDDLETVGPQRATIWGAAAFQRADLWIRWTVTVDATTAKALEVELIASHTGLWNRHIPRQRARR